MKKYFSSYIVIAFAYLAISLMAFQSHAMEQEDTKIYPIDAPDGVRVLGTRCGFGVNPQKLRSALSNLFHYARAHRIENLFVPKFGLIKDPKEFFTIVSEEFNKFVTDDRSRDGFLPMKLILISYEPEVGHCFHAGLREFLTHFEYLRNSIIVRHNNINDILFALHGDKGPFRENSAVFAPGRGQLFNDVKATISRLAKERCTTELSLDELTAPSLREFKASGVGSEGAPSLTRDIARRLAKSGEALMSSWPRVVLDADYVRILDEEKIALDHKPFLTSFETRGGYAVPLSKLSLLMQYLGFPEITAQIPTPLHLILASNDLKNNQDRYKALSNINLAHRNGHQDSSHARRDDGNEAAILDSFRDPISKAVLQNPVRTTSGYSYEKSTIELWVEHAKCDPFTGEKLSLDDLRENSALKEAITAHERLLNGQSQDELEAIRGALAQLQLLRVSDHNLVRYLRAQAAKMRSQAAAGPEPHELAQIEGALQEACLPPQIVSKVNEFTRFNS